MKLNQFNKNYHKNLKMIKYIKNNIAKDFY